METKDFYEILGVTEDEKKLPKKDFNKTLKKKFRDLSLKYHPDRLVDKTEKERKEAEEKFKSISEAYTTLSDENKRKEYDMKSNGFGGFDPFESGFNPFGSGFNPFGDPFGGMRQRVNKGEDCQCTVTITLKEAMNGTKKIAKVRKGTKCVHCNGTGSADKTSSVCPKCGGTGVVTKTKIMGNTRMMQQSVCDECHGSGKLIKNKCKHCNGTGIEYTMQDVEIEVPSGVFDGAIMKLEGMGSEPNEYVPNAINVNGDLIVSFVVSKDDRFGRNGDDLIYTLDLTLYEALVGCTKTITTLDDKTLSLKIPELTTNGKQFRFKGKGVKNVNFNSYGDLIVKVRYILPKKLTDKQKNLLKELYD